MKNKHRVPLATLLMLSVQLSAQVSGLPLQSPAYHIMERLSILNGGNTPLHPEVKEYTRKDAARMAQMADTAAIQWSVLDRADLQYLLRDNNDWLPDSLLQPARRPLLKHFYRTPAHFFEVNTPDFSLRANPMLNFSLGGQQNDAELLFANQRGLEVRAMVDRKVFIYTNLVESQARLPNYVTQRAQAYKSLPGAGNYKNYRPRYAELTDAFDYNLANAHIGFNVSKHVGLELGHGRQFIGNGHRSLFLSDVGNLAFYLKMNTRVWRFHYQNLFFELSPGSAQPDNMRIARKFAAMHYLNFKITPRMAVGLFEATVFNRSQQFEFQYLNPVILYRSIEGMIGSPDNVLIGFDGRWDLFRRVRLYGQLLLDEFLLRELVRPAQKGWWGNKYGIQAGMKYINALGIDHLDVQIEFNSARPYTWSHFDSLNSYTHYNQPLAHPLWANFREIAGVLKYQPHPNIFLNARLMHARAGEDEEGKNWGGNPLLAYGTRVQEYGNTIGQGVAARINLIAVDASWMFRHNMFLDMRLLWRDKDSEDNTRDLRTQVWGIGIRMNFWPQGSDF